MENVQQLKGKNTFQQRGKTLTVTSPMWGEGVPNVCNVWSSEQYCVNLFTRKKKRQQKNPCLLPINFFALEYNASLNFQHLSDVEVKSLEY